MSDAAVHVAPCLSHNVLDRIPAMFHVRGHNFNGERTGLPTVHEIVLMKPLYYQKIAHIKGSLNAE
jgi:hypothetical protein